ncbi:Catenin alpha-1 [Acipenser ruthenus]|uniref:Catenin alpha-1 n=1 Tax=Acipenser ruthenus TaxID=7906 RepID=A0A662YQV3_ACIRT|nr:Catenin alpha-1 [Acipenser ruthenus]
MATLLESGVTCIIKAKSIERVIAPIAAQVCHLIIISEWGDSDGKFAHLEEEAEEVAKVTKQLALVASRLAEESEDDILRKEMGPARELVVISGNNMLLAAQKLCIQPQYPQHREELIASAKDVLMGTLKILLIEDDAIVRRIVTAAHWLLDCITLLESAKDVSSLLKSFQGFSEALLLLNCLVKSRIQEIRDNSQQEFLDHSLKTLKNCISMLYTALLTSLKHPQNEQARSAKKYITDQMDTTITNIISLLRNDSNEKPQANAGSYSHKLHSLFQLLSRSTCSVIKDSDFDSLVRDLVFHCMAVANASREKKQLKVVKHCQRLLQLRSKISGQAKLLENHAKHMQQDLEESCASMKKELQNLDSSMVTAILYHILDSFTQTKEPLQELVKAAEQSSNIHGVNQLDQLQPFLPAFLMHADRMIQVAGFVSASASNVKNIQAIESSMKCLKLLKDNVVPILLDLNKNSHRSTALERLAVLCQQWESETQQLLGALDDVVNIYEFTDLSIKEIVDDKAKCEKAFKAQSVEHFYKHTSNLIGHVNIIVQAAKRHVDKSNDPIFRNGLLVLVKQVESAIPPDCNAPQNVFCNSSSAYTLAEAALFLKRETDKWEDENNQIVQVTKEMATQMYNMAQFLKKKGPIKTKEEFIISAKQIAVNGQVITNFAHIVAEYCLDRRCATELLCAAEQILTLTNQLNIISSVKAATPGNKSSDEILVKNAQNLMQIVLKSIKAAETACIKGLRQPPPNTDEAQAAALCIQWKKMLQRHRVREALNPEMDDLGLRKTRLSQATPSLAPVIKIPDSQLKYQ